MLTSRAAVIRESSGPFTIEPITLENPRADEVLVEVAGAGMCHTDLVVRDQYFPTPLPAVLGHEGSGVVIAVGEAVTRVEIGDHVVLSFGSCGTCQNCLQEPPAIASIYTAAISPGDGPTAVPAAPIMRVRGSAVISSASRPLPIMHWPMSATS